MRFESMGKMSRSLRSGALIAGVVGILASVLAWNQVRVERRIDTEDVDRRARGLVHQLSFSVREALLHSDTKSLDSLTSRLEGHSRLIGCAVFLPDGSPMACAKSASEYSSQIELLAQRVIAGEGEVAETLRSDGPAVRVLVNPIESKDGVRKGIVAVLHSVSYIDDRATARLVQFMFWILLMVLVLSTLIAAITWLSYDRPLSHLAEWMRRLRTENCVDAPPSGLPVGALLSESDRLAASFRAARSRNLLEARQAVRKVKSWTRERLRTHAIECLGADHQLVVASYREPYMHVMQNNRPQMMIPPGGLVTALDPVLRSCGGLWVAVGNGSADKQTSDQHGRIIVPPGEGRYTLRRLWLSPEEEMAYSCCSNEAIWPMCLLAHERPVFRTSDWEAYTRVNRHFADAILEEIGSSRAVVLVQDYQLALVPRILKAARPDLTVGLFWHIPWPNAEAIRICPWRAEIVSGMLGADLIGFHLQQFCNNFVETVDRTLETRLDRDHMAVEYKRRLSLIRPFPISVQDWSERGVTGGEELKEQIADLLQAHELQDVELAVGVDRIDHSKGLPERFRAFAHFLQKYPQHRGKITLVQLAAPSRMHLPRYREHVEELRTLVKTINTQFQTASWTPIAFLVGQHDGSTVHAFLNAASVAIVSSLHDGMNLVAKEFVAAQYSNRGVLILSEFAGAARDMPEALVINPYDTERFADAIRYAAEMPLEERQSRMERLRGRVEENNIYRWAADFISELSAAVPTVNRTVPASRSNDLASSAFLSEHDK